MKIERAQLRSARRITGNLRTTPGGVVLQDAGLEEVRMRMETASAVIYDKWRAKEEGDLRRRVAVEGVTQRTTKNCWRKLCGELVQNIPPEDTIMEEMTQRQQPQPRREGIPNRVMRTPASKEDPPPPRCS